MTVWKVGCRWSKNGEARSKPAIQHMYRKRGIGSKTLGLANLKYSPPTATELINKPPNPTQSLPNPTQYSEKELLILQALKNNPSITQGGMAQSLGMDTNQIKYYLNKLKNGSNPAIRHIGTTRNGYWEVLVEI